MQKVAQQQARQEAQQRAQQQGQTQQQVAQEQAKDQARRQQETMLAFAMSQGGSHMFGQNNPQAKAAEEAMKGMTVGQYVNQSTPEQQRQLAALMQADSSTKHGGGLPPSTASLDSMHSKGVNVPLTGLPMAGTPDFGSATLGKDGLILPDGSPMPGGIPSTLIGAAGASNSFTAGSLAGPPPVETITTYSTVSGGVSSSETYVPASAEIVASNSQSYPTDNYTTASADVDPANVYRSDQSLSVDWSAASMNNMSRSSGADPNAYVQPVYMPPAQTPPPEQTVQYMPTEVRQEKVEVQQVQQDKHEVFVYQQPPKPAEPSKPSVQKRVENINPVFTSPPVVPKSNSISSVLAGLQQGQPGIKPNENKSTGQTTDQPDENKLGGQPGIKPNESKPVQGSGIPTTGNILGGQSKESPRTEGSLGEHLSRLQRGGGRSAPSSKDILGQSDLPPEVKLETDESEEEKKDS